MHVRWMTRQGSSLWHKFAYPRTRCGQPLGGSPQYHVRKPSWRDGRCSVCFIAERKRAARERERANRSDGQITAKEEK